MKHLTTRRLLALVGYVSFLAGAHNATAQVGPVQPVLILPSGSPEIAQKRPDFSEDYIVPMDVTVNASGEVTNVVVTESTGNVEADGAAAAFMRDRKFLPAVNDTGSAMDATIRVNVNMFKRGTRKVARVTSSRPRLRSKRPACSA